MTYRSRPRSRRRDGFRPSSLTQHSEPTPRDAARRARTHPHDGTPGRDAREWFAHLRPILLASRPLIKPAETVTYPHTVTLPYFNRKTGEHTTREATYNQTVHRPAVYGKPTYKNVITENGEHQ